MSICFGIFSIILRESKGILIYKNWLLSHEVDHQSIQNALN